MFDFSPFYLLFIPALLLLLLFRKKERYPYIPRKTLLTKAELKFFHALKSVINNRYEIAPKVRLGDIITCSEKDWYKGFGPKISAKHIDFVIYEETSSNILCCIELDDSSHNHPKRIERDKFINNALESSDVPLIRIKTSKAYDLALIEKEIAVALK